MPLFFFKPNKLALEKVREMISTGFLYPFKRCRLELGALWFRLRLKIKVDAAGSFMV
jgi:hypothetical protein